jgi:hypothetical protein
MSLSRRGLLGGLLATPLARPAIIRLPGLLMPLGACDTFRPNGLVCIEQIAREANRLFRAMHYGDSDHNALLWSPAYQSCCDTDCMTAERSMSIQQFSSRLLAPMVRSLVEHIDGAKLVAPPPVPRGVLEAAVSGPVRVLTAYCIHSDSIRLRLDVRTA